MENITNFFSQGGFWMWPILVMSIVGLAVILERSIVVVGRHNIKADEFWKRLDVSLKSQNTAEAIRRCSQHANSALAIVLKSGLEKADQGPDMIRNSIEEASLNVIPEVTKRGTLLQNIANIATLLGLLGTILGLIDAFSALATVTDPEQQTKMLTAGISVAMNTTAFGLMVAIPCLLAHVLLSAVTKSVLDEIEEYSVKLENTLVIMLKGR